MCWEEVLAMRITGTDRAGDIVGCVGEGRQNDIIDRVGVV